MQIGMFVAFSHKLTKEQIEDAESSLGVTTFVYPSEDIQKQMMNIGDDLDPKETEAMIDGKVVKTSSFVHVRWRELI